MLQYIIFSTCSTDRNNKIIIDCIVCVISGMTVHQWSPCHWRCRSSWSGARSVMLHGLLCMGTTLVADPMRNCELLMQQYCRHLSDGLVCCSSSMCPELPIDVVYTWVNGSDPKLIAELRALHREINRCTIVYCVFSLVQTSFWNIERS